MSKTKGVQVQFVARANGPERLVCEAEIHFEEMTGDGVLCGLKLVGFSLWQSDGKVSVTLPSRTWGEPGERKFFDLLRAGDGGAEAVKALKAAIIAAYDARKDGAK